MESMIISIIWGDIISLVVICFCIVLTIMALFVGLLSIFKMVKEKKAPEIQQPEVQTTINEKPETKISDAEYAVIATAIHLYFNNNHDDESNMLTIKNVKYNYSPWRVKKS